MLAWALIIIMSLNGNSQSQVVLNFNDRQTCEQRGKEVSDYLTKVKVSYLTLCVSQEANVTNG